MLSRVDIASNTHGLNIALTKSPTLLKAFTGKHYAIMARGVKRGIFELDLQAVTPLPSVIILSLFIK